MWRSVQRRRRFAYGVISGAGSAALILYALENYKATVLQLNEQTFSPFIVKSKDRVSPTSSIFTLAAARHDGRPEFYDNLWKQGVWSLQVKQPQLQIARAYTPIPPSLSRDASSSSKDNDLRLLIRLDPKGEVSGYLHKLPEGAIIDLRGPNLEYTIPEDAEEILFLAGGTGIAPALQVAHTIFKQRLAGENAQPRMHILWACRTREDCQGGVNDTAKIKFTGFGGWKSLLGSGRPTPQANMDEAQNPIVKELALTKAEYPGLVKVDYFVDEENNFIKGDDLKILLNRQEVTQRDSISEKASSKQANRRLVLISGPDGFVNHYAGPKTWKNGREEQGKLGGVLAKISDVDGWEVWKL